MDTAVFVCVPANPGSSVIWSLEPPITSTRPNYSSYFVLIENVDTDNVSVSCTVDDKTSTSTLSIQGECIFFCTDEKTF